MKQMLVNYVKRMNFVGTAYASGNIHFFIRNNVLPSSFFCAVESNSCTFQVASSSGNLLRSDSEYTRVHALPFYTERSYRCRLTRTHVLIHTSLLGYNLDKNLSRNRFMPVKRVHLRNLLRACASEFISLFFNAKNQVLVK